MSWNTSCGVSVMLLVVIVTYSFQPTVSLHTQRCVEGGCKLTCPKSPSYNSCQQICTGGNCNLMCHAAEKCDFTCTGEAASPFCAPQGRAICRALVEAVKWTAKESTAKPVVLVVDAS